MGGTSSFGLKQECADKQIMVRKVSNLKQNVRLNIKPLEKGAFFGMEAKKGCDGLL